MARWITDGSLGFTVNGNVLTHNDDDAYINNAMWQEGDGVSAGQHYWKIHFPVLSEHGAGVGLTSRDFFGKGFSCKAIHYSGNLTNCSSLLVENFGPSPQSGDMIGILVVFEDDRLKVYIDVNGKNLGLAFDVPASTFETIFPTVCFHNTGSATCTKQSEIPNVTDRPTTKLIEFEGDWKLKMFEENNVVVDLPCSITSRISKEETGEYSWKVKVANCLWATISNEYGRWKASVFACVVLFRRPEHEKIEDAVRSFINEVHLIEVTEVGDLYIKSDKGSTTWIRYNSAFGPYIGKPFAS